MLYDDIDTFMTSSANLQTDIDCLGSQMDSFDNLPEADLKKALDRNGIRLPVPFGSIHGGFHQFLICLHNIKNDSLDHCEQHLRLLNQSLPYFMMGLVISARSLAGKSGNFTLTPSINLTMQVLGYPADLPQLYRIATDLSVHDVEIDYILETLEEHHKNQQTHHAEGYTFYRPTIPFVEHLRSANAQEGTDVVISSLQPKPTIQ